jgi:23S rRNA (cytidine1920-2'-O)/16S rRNA (cytidine1409-2'-O)-methyltransferase
MQRVCSGFDGSLTSTNAMAMSTRKRADLLLLERGLFESRSQAQAAIAAGLVTANGEPVRKPSDALAVDCKLRAVPAHPWVSRGGVKLAAALDHFGFAAEGRTGLDLGASTGGFTEVLLARGAQRVYAVDVGHGQVHARVAARPQVIVLEDLDARKLTPALIPEPLAFATVDVSFISLKLVLPPALALMRSPAWLVALIKPQFEAGRRRLKKGVVRDPQVHAAVCDDVAAFVTARGLRVAGVIPSPITGGDGNHEFLIGATIH